MATIEQSVYEIDALWEAERFDNEQQQKAEHLIGLIPDDARSLLDVGCGNGFFIKVLRGSSRGAHLTRICGVERSHAALSHVEGEKQLAEIDALPFEDESFDVVVCNNVLGNLPIKLPRVGEGRDHVYHLYVIEHPDRDGLASHLKSQGVDTVINYPRALPFLPAYERFAFKPGDFPAAHAMQSRILSLPMFAEITAEQQEHVAESIRSFGRV